MFKVSVCFSYAWSDYTLLHPETVLFLLPLRDPVTAHCLLARVPPAVTAASTADPLPAPAAGRENT